jgi:hypothetical protein
MFGSRAHAVSKLAVGALAGARASHSGQNFLCNARIAPILIKEYLQLWHILDV